MRKGKQMKRIVLITMLAASMSPALDFQIGGYQSDLSGIYIDFRKQISNYFIGVGASEGFIEVASVERKLVPSGTGYVSVESPSTAQAALHNIGVLGGLNLMQAEKYKVQGSIGISYSLLDGTENGQSDRSRDFLAIPLKVDGIWTPKIIGSLGLASALGVEYRIGLDKSDLYRELSSFVFTARLGISL